MPVGAGVVPAPGWDQGGRVRVVDGPGLGGGQFGVGGGQDLVQDVAGGRGGATDRRQAVVVVGVGDDVGPVEVAAAAHGDVEVFAAHARGGDGVGLVHG